MSMFKFLRNNNLKVYFSLKSLFSSLLEEYGLWTEVDNRWVPVIKEIKGELQR